MAKIRISQLHTDTASDEKQLLPKRVQYYKDRDTNLNFNIDGNSGAKRQVDEQGSDKKSFHMGITGIAKLDMRCDYARKKGNNTMVP